MPIYEFECTVCKIRVEVDRSIHEERNTMLRASNEPNLFSTRHFIQG
jgi:predicted nucleic acid-binding Zn ribbon protein